MRRQKQTDRDDHAGGLAGAGVPGRRQEPEGDAPMKIESTILVERTPARTWAFLADPHTAPTWDRSVARVDVITPGTIGVGTIVLTTAPSSARQRFRIVEFDPSNVLAFTLLESSVFRTARLRFVLDPVAAGTRVTHEIDFVLRVSTLFFYPIMRLTHRKALATDLELLRRAIETRT
jgi:hypothetical protein